MIGELSVLNAGAGDLKVVFNHQDADEAVKAIKMLRDMRERGYSVLVELPDGSYARAHEIDATRGQYILLLPSETAEAVKAAHPPEPGTCECGCGAPVTPGRRFVRGHWNKLHKGKGRGAYRVRVPVSRARAVGVARTAGG
jgi:hypothetical protein